MTADQRPNLEALADSARKPSPAMESWAPLDLAALVDEYGLEVPKAESMFRRDGYALGYRGKTNVLFGQPESGKSMIVLGGLVVPEIKNAVRLNKGKIVTWIDYEDTWQVFLGRLVGDLGIPLDDVVAHCHYIAPEGALAESELKETLRGVVTDETETVVIDSVNESMVTLGLDPIGTKDATDWRQKVLKPIQSLTNKAALWLIDHEPISATMERRQAFGAQGKFAGVQGAQLRAVVVDQPRPQQEGAVALYVTKDRNGDVRAHSRAPEAGLPVQLAGTVMFSPVEARGHRGVDLAIIEPQGTSIDDTELIGIIEKSIMDSGEKGVSKNQVRGLVRAGNVARKNDAIDAAVDEFVAANPDRYKAIPKGNGVAYRAIEMPVETPSEEMQSCNHGT